MTGPASLIVECLGPDDIVVDLQPGEWPNRVKLGTREPVSRSSGPLRGISAAGGLGRSERDR